MTQQESLLIQNLISEDEKIGKDSFIYANHELSSWHKSKPVNFDQFNNHKSQARCLPKLTQKNIDPSISLSLLIESSPCKHQNQFLLKSSEKSTEKSLENHSNNPTISKAEPKSLESLLLKLKEIPNKPSPRVPNSISLKPYKRSLHIKTNSEVSSSPKSIPSKPLTTFEQSLNIRKVIGLPYQNSSFPRPSPGRIQKSLPSKPLGKSYLLTKVKKFPTYSLDFSSSKSMIYSELSQKSQIKKFMLSPMS